MLFFQHAGIRYSVISNQDDDAEFSTRKVLWTSIVCGAISFLPFAIMGDLGKGRACFILVAITVVILMLRWEMRTRTWFLLVMSVLFGGQLLAVILLRWTDHSYPGVSLLGIGTVYLLSYYGVIKFFELIFDRH